MTMLSPKPSMVSTRPRSSTGAGHGGHSRLSSSRRWTGWTGSSPAAAAHRQHPAGRSRGTLLCHDGATRHGGVTQTKQPPANQGRFTCPLTPSIRMTKATSLPPAWPGHPEGRTSTRCREGSHLTESATLQNFRPAGGGYFFLWSSIFAISRWCWRWGSVFWAQSFSLALSPPLA
jgi:hypothetical protein